MKIEAVTVCKDYGDFLAATLPHNRSVFDKLVVVTSDKDEYTHHLCEVYHVECVKTNIFEKNFNKAKGINLGLSRLDRDGVIIHFDSDIAFPARTRQILEMAQLRDDTIYGCHRVMCDSYEDWCRYLAKPQKLIECDIYIHNKYPWPVGTQIGKFTHNPENISECGYVPIGFVQAWQEKDGVKRVYPEEHSSAARSDLAFAYQWDRQHRALIPELTVVHLGTPDQKTKMGVNWNGRASQRFGPEPF